jgi:hypothetical protein
LSHASSLFCSGYFGDRISWIICPDRPLISVQVARITGASISAQFLTFCWYIIYT